MTAQKPVDQVSGHRTKSELEGRSTSVTLPTERLPPPRWVGATVSIDLNGERVEVPKPPQRLLKSSREAWAMFWASPEASMVRPHHLPALRRLVHLYDEEARVRRRVESTHTASLAGPTDADGKPTSISAELPGHLGAGAAGQVVESADYRVLTKIREQIRALEDRFAATPLAQFRVGWQQAHMVNEQARAHQATALAQAAADLQQRHEQHRNAASSS